MRTNASNDLELKLDQTFLSKNKNYCIWTHNPLILSQES